MNESKFSSKIKSIPSFRSVSLERATEVGIPDLCLISRHHAPLTIFVELKVVNSIDCKIGYQPAQPAKINELDKLGALVGTLVYCRKERVIVWVQPQYTQKISRNNTKVSSVLLEKMGDVICSDQDFEWIGIVDLFFHSLIVEKVYRISLN
tara:strand:- start:868 stop:1320 length:453 start_codon:yes stop_codon:yes gene_type:complete